MSTEIRRELNKLYREGKIVVTRDSTVWGVVAMQSADGRIAITVTEGPEGFGWPLSGQSRHQIYVDKQMVMESDWHYGRAPSDEIIDEFARLIFQQRNVEIM